MPTSDNTLTATSDGQSQQASEVQEQGTQQQTSQGGQSATEFENIQTLQSVYDKRFAAQQAELQRAQQQYRQVQAQLQTMEDASAPDDYARMEIQLKRAQQERDQLAGALQAEYDAREAANARSNALGKLAAKYGVSASELDKATDYDEAVELAIAARTKQQAKVAATKEERAQANKPDIGGGRTATNLDEWQEEWKKATERKDSKAQQKLLRTRPAQ